jgi:hypothetical protein
MICSIDASLVPLLPAAVGSISFVAGLIDNIHGAVYWSVTLQAKHAKIACNKTI